MQTYRAHDPGRDIMKRTCFFDLETEYLIQEVDPSYNTLNFAAKQARRLKIIPKLHMAIACVITNSEEPEVFYFETGQEAELIQALLDFDMIIGHNIIDFDYIVLAPHFKEKELFELQQKSYDTFLKLQDVSNKTWLGLDELCQINLGTSKNLDTMEVPRLWRSGEKQKVKDYCYNDVMMLKTLFLYGKENGKLKYPVKNYGKTVSISELKVPWLNLDL
jgi:hypothetical protein